MLSAPALLLVYTFALNAAPDPPAVVEGRRRRALYQTGQITEEEYRNPILFRQKAEQKQSEAIDRLERRTQWEIDMAKKEQGR